MPREGKLASDQLSSAFFRSIGLFSRQDQITANDVARVLNLSVRQSRDLLNTWVGAGWLEMTSASRKTRAYQLSAEYRHFIGGITAVIKSKSWMPSRNMPGIFVYRVRE